MKGQKGKTTDVRVPLCSEALRIIDLAAPHNRGCHLFPSTRRGVIADATMSRLMEHLRLTSRPHGVRSSLGTRLAEATDASNEVAETMLDHTEGGS